MRTAKDLAKIFSDLKPDTKVWATWIDEEEIIEKVQEQLDNQDEEETITAKEIITDGFIDNIFDSLSNDDYLWERFSDSFNDSVHDEVNKYLKQMQDDKELWDTEMGNNK